MSYKKRLSIFMYANNIESFVVFLDEIKKRLQSEERDTIVIFNNNQLGSFEIVLSELPVQMGLNLGEMQKNV
jgi:hypothetical protein